jgi:diaminopimelate decarboxylase
MEKKPFITKDEALKIIARYPTPFHIYDEDGIRKNCEAVKEAFSWNEGFREYFAVKALPNPFILKIYESALQSGAGARRAPGKEYP